MLAGMIMGYYILQVDHDCKGTDSMSANCWKNTSVKVTLHPAEFRGKIPEQNPYQHRSSFLDKLQKKWGLANLGKSYWKYSHNNIEGLQESQDSNTEFLYIDKHFHK